MAFPYAKSSANSSFLHTIKDSQTDTCRENYNIGEPEPREGWAEGALAPPLFGIIKKIIMIKLENSFVSD